MLKSTIELEGKKFFADLQKPIDISIALNTGEDNANAWDVNAVKIEPVMNEFFTGSVKLGGAVNFMNISFNPHGNGTHTECVGHISEKWDSINKTLKNYFFIAELVSVNPEEKNGDFLITENLVKNVLMNKTPEALILRTLPNLPEKKQKKYFGTNPAYFTEEAMQFISEKNIQHLLTDLPSVDKESDGGKLLCHRIFWQYPQVQNNLKTIT
jgi:arylformamidase